MEIYDSKMSKEEQHNGKVNNCEQEPKPGVDRHQDVGLENEYDVEFWMKVSSIIPEVGKTLSFYDLEIQLIDERFTIVFTS